MLGTVGCRKGTQFKITFTMPPQGAGQHYAWDRDTVGFQLYSPSLNTQNRSALVEEEMLKPHVPQLPFPTVGSLNRIQRGSTT